MNQKNEYSFSLSSQVDAKTREAQQFEKEARESKADNLKLSRELESNISKSQARRLPHCGSPAL